MDEAPDLHEDLLFEAARRVSDVARAEPELIFLADAQMNYVDVSDSVCDLLGYTREELLQLRVTDVAVEESAPDEYQEMIEVGARLGRAKIRARDGSVFPFDYSAAEVQVDGRRLFVSVGSVSGETASEGAKPVREPGPGRPVRVVVADDHEPTRLLMRTLLDFMDGIEIVGEAKNGLEAVSLVMRLNPDVALLDVHMPRLDGIGTAETVRALRPTTAVVLHTAQPDGRLRSRAEHLRVPLLDKMRFDDVLNVVRAEGRSPTVSVLPDPRIEAAILTALTANGGGTPVLVIRATGVVPLYSLAAGELLGLPLPPRETTVSEVLSRFSVLREDGTPLSDEDRPISRAIREGAAVDELVVIERDGRRTPVRALVDPFFNEGGDFLGATLYYDPI